MNVIVAKKQLARNILRRFGRNCPGNACVPEIGFVNHRRLQFRISLSQGVFWAPPWRADLKPRGEEGNLACAYC
jgi:hypothetical protein